MTKTCPTCGKDNMDQARFCVSCGKPLPKDNKIKCPKCHKLNDDYHQFCIYCGAKLIQPVNEWKEEDLKVSNASHPPQYRSDPNLVFCPTCNYACMKDWDACPMCNTPITTETHFPDVPIFIDDAGEEEKSGSLKKKIFQELKKVSDNMSVISMLDLATAVGGKEKEVLEIVKDIIATGEIEGHIDLATNEFVSEIVTEPPIFVKDKLPEKKAAKISTMIKEDQDGSSINEQVKEIVQSLELKRGYDFEGGRVHFKVVLKNNSSLVIHDVKVYLDLPDFFKSEDEEISELIPVLNPGESRGLDFYLEPKKCGTAEISATVLFKDIYGKRHAKLVSALEIQIKSPIVAPSKSSFEYTRQLTEKLASDMKMFKIQDIDTELLYNAAFRAISKFDMACVHDVKTDNTMEAWFSARSKVDEEPIIARSIISTDDNVLEIRVWCDNATELTGFLARIITNLRDEIELIRSIKNEDKRKAINLMSLARNLEVVKNFAGLNWQAGDIRNVVIEIKKIVQESMGDDLRDIVAEMASWSQELAKMEPDDHIDEDQGEQLYNDAERWQNLINRQLGIVQNA